MDAPPEKKESNTISMMVDTLLEGKKLLSPVHRINGYPFRLQLDSPQITRGPFNEDVAVSLVCYKSLEAVLWRCTATVKCNEYSFKLVFRSWKLDPNGERLGCFVAGTLLQVTIVTEEDGNSWRLRPSLDSFTRSNEILVIGEEKKEIRVNKEFLASQSPYFERLFYGDFKEKNMDKIPIGDVEYKEFNNIIRMIYGSSKVSLTDKNVHRVLDLADRFELKIIEDKVVSFLLSNKTSYTLAQKLLISQERNFPSLKNWCFNECSGFNEARTIKNAPEYADFSDELKAEILDRVLDMS